ncbi:MAG: nucleoside transporter [Kiritimatiellae bacterium]|nr:nucleoside transporter [Kiritimatiellia bacterium]
MGIYNLVSFLGIFFLLACAWLLAPDKRKVNWRLLGWGLAIQLGFALFIFRVPLGARVFLFANDAVRKVLDSASAGTQFLFGRLALPPGATNADGETSLGFFLAFQGFPTIVFFSALVAILYHVRVLPLLIRGFSALFTRLMRVSGAESLCAASNIFVGVESALTIKPHLDDMTRSELCTVLTAGMATVASNVLAVYVFTLEAHFKNIAGHLISASFLSAPAALMMAKLVLPESEQPKTLGVAVNPHDERDGNVFEAIIKGANAGVRLIAGICALLLAVLGLVALVNLFLGALGGLFGAQEAWTLEGLLGWLFRPFTLMLGVPWGDVQVAARIIGERAVLTEVPAYKHLAAALANGQLSPRSAVITAYALCGFAHVASMSIFVGGVAALAPGRTRTLTQVGFRALLAATLACLMTAAVAGTFCGGGSVLFD